jgi:hypothetical protein
VANPGASPPTKGVYPLFQPSERENFSTKLVCGLLDLNNRSADCYFPSLRHSSGALAQAIHTVVGNRPE